MNQEQHTTKHEKGKHLTFLERAIIQVRLKDKWSPYRIAKEIGCSPNTVRNEILLLCIGEQRTSTTLVLPNPSMKDTA